MDLMSKEGAQVFIEGALEAIRRDAAVDGQIIPFATLFITTGEDGNPIRGVGMRNFDLSHNFNEDKQDIADMLRLVAKRLGAVASVVMTEAWVAEVEGLDAHKAKQQMDAWIARHGSLESYPGRKEIAMVAFEHKALGRQLWMAPISRGGGKMEVGDFTNVGENVEGRFFRIIPSMTGN